MSDEVLKLDIKVDKKTLNRFLLRNNFLRLGGVIGLFISAAAIVILIVLWSALSAPQRVILFFLALMFTVIQPLSLLMKGWNQLKSGTFREPFHYEFSAAGMRVENMAGSVDVKWPDIRKAVVTKDAIYLYMNALSAFILPRAACKESYARLTGMIEEYRK